MLRNRPGFALFSLAFVLAACGGDDGSTPLDPDTAPRASIDRFSAEAGTLMVRTAGNGLPEANAPIDFDQGPFITKGLGPDGELVEYYNFDVMPTESAGIYALFRASDGQPVEGQLNIVNVIPGDDGYNDFWNVHKVMVPDDYVANSITSFSALIDAGHPMEQTNIIVNCPVVPEGSTATKRLGGGATGLTRGWYKDQVVTYFELSEASLTGDTSSGYATVPVSPIHVTFNVNPDQNNPDSGPASGFVTEGATDQTHNVVATVPGDAGYSPLWAVSIYDNADFDSVMDLTTAQAATMLAQGPTVNCPIVSVQ